MAVRGQGHGKSRILVVQSAGKPSKPTVAETLTGCRRSVEQVSFFIAND